MLSKSIGSNIKQFRIEKALSQEELAEKLFVTRQTVSNYEIGKSNPDIDMLQKIAAALEVELTWLLYGKPVLSDRKADIRIAAIITGIFFSVLIFTVFLNIHTQSLKSVGNAMPNVLVRLILHPLFFLLLGIWMMKLTDCFLGIGKPKGNSKKLGRILIVSILGGNLFFVIPHLAICLFSLLKMQTVLNSIALFFTRIRIYESVALFFLDVMYTTPYFYIPVGTAVGLFFFHKKPYAA